MIGVGLNVGNLPVTEVYVGSTPVQAVYVGAKMVWSAVKEVVQITLGTGTQASDQLRAELADRGMHYLEVEEIPFEIELVGSGSARQMFMDYSSLTSVPAMNTGNVTDMNEIFYGCRALTSVPEMDTSNVTDMSRAFSDCESLTHAPDMETSSVTNMFSLFSNCSALTHVPDMDTSSATSMRNMFGGCELLTTVPDMDTSNVTDASYMLYDCSALTDGNVRLIGRNPSVVTEDMIVGSGLTRDPFYDADGNPI